MKSNTLYLRTIKNDENFWQSLEKKRFIDRQINKKRPDPLNAKEHP